MNFIQKEIKAFKESKDNRTPDYTLFFLSSVLIIISILFSYSLSIYTVVYWDYSQYHFFIRQFVTGSVGIVIMLLISQRKPDYIVPRLGWFLFGLFLFAILAMQFLPASLVTESGGAKRWIRLSGISISPVEFFKIGFVYFLAYSFQKRLTDIEKLPFKDELVLLAPYGIIFGFVAYLVAVLQKDLGHTVLLGAILIVMLIFANRSWKVFLSLISIVLVTVGGLIYFFPHRISRLQGWWCMVQDSILGMLPDYFNTAWRVYNCVEPYQVGHSLNAINNGGFFGVGLGEGALKLGFLSEVHTDFVIAGIIEETGLIGLLFIISVLFTIILRVFRISRRIKDKEFHLFSLGIGLMISMTFFINSYGITGMIPIKGIAVPFLSYGGSSLLSVSIAIGLILSISRNLPKESKDV